MSRVSPGFFTVMVSSTALGYDWYSTPVPEIVSSNERSISVVDVSLVLLDIVSLPVVGRFVLSSMTHVGESDTIDPTSHRDVS